MMRAPQHGLAMRAPQARGVGAFGVDIPFVHSPYEIEALMKQLKSYAGLIDQTVRSCSKVDETTRSGWGTFYIGVQDFVRQTIPANVLNFPEFNGLFEQAMSLMGQADAWVAKLATFGCIVPVVPKPPGTLDTVLKVVGAIGAAATTVGIVYAGVKLAEVVADRMKK